jgi:hypothetical protein
MNDDEVARRRGLTFAQAEGLSPLPAQLARTDITLQLRAVLWKFIHDEITRSTQTGGFGTYVGTVWGKILRNVHVLHYHRFTDDFSTDLTDVIKSVRGVFEKGDYAAIYGWLQFVLQHQPPPGFGKQLEGRLRYCRAPYRVIAEGVLCPIGSDLDAAIVERALKDVQASSLAGGREHLKLAVTELTNGNFADSVRESIHAVESVVRVLEPSGDSARRSPSSSRRTTFTGPSRRAFLPSTVSPATNKVSAIPCWRKKHPR